MAQSPDHTSRYSIEPQVDPYILPFAPELIPFIVRGEKVKTYRYGKKYDYLKIGDNVKIQNLATKTIIASASILSKETVLFAELPLESGLTHESYASKERQREVFSGYYAYLKRSIRDDDPFLIIEFKLRGNYDSFS